MFSATRAPSHGGSFGGRTKRLFEDRNYRFIEADDGRAVYFDGSSLKGIGIGSLSLDQPVEIEVEARLTGVIEELKFQGHIQL